VHRRGSGDCAVDRELPVRLSLFFVLICVSWSSWGCVNLKAKLDLHGKILSVDQKIELDQTYSFLKEDFLVNITLSSGQRLNTFAVVIKVDQRTDQSLKSMSHDELLVDEKKTTEVITSPPGSDQRFKYHVTVTTI